MIRGPWDSKNLRTDSFLELEREKLKHSDYMEKSDEFVNLLETDRQKLKLALEKEKALNDGQVRQYEKLKRETSEEIDKLKKFSMLLVEEKQSGRFSNLTSVSDWLNPIEAEHEIENPYEP